jgi:hypothetical protein
MKTIDLTIIAEPVEALLHLATDDGILIRLPDGKVYFLSSVPEEEEDTFADEIARTRQNSAFMALLDARSQAEPRVSSQEARRQLGIDE